MKNKLLYIFFAVFFSLTTNILKNDPFFPRALYSENIPFCYRAFWSYMGYFGKALGSLELANAVVTFVFSIIFVSGLCVLCWYLSGSPYVGILVAVFSSIPMEATGSVVYGLRYSFRPAILNDIFNNTRIGIFPQLMRREKLE